MRFPPKKNSGGTSAHPRGPPSTTHAFTTSFPRSLVATALFSPTHFQPSITALLILTVHSSIPVSTELISAIDVRYKDELIFSKVQETEAETGWFLCSPFRVDLLGQKESIQTPIRHVAENKAWLKHLEERDPFFRKGGERKGSSGAVAFIELTRVESLEINNVGVDYVVGNRPTVVRDHRGYALAALSQKFPIPHVPVVIEAMAAQAAVQLALDLKLDRVSFEGDSTQVITALQSSESNYSSYGHLVAETQNKTLSLQSFTFEHVRRSANSVAHDRYLDPLEFWTDDDHLNKFIGLVEASVDLDQLENGEYMISSSYDPTLSALPFDFVSWVSSHELDVS
uniref:RNase H type-1 domain-containing protein n=1 Tax=Fagus sylvatica TaxID=28930 RepID=A0A2N9J0B2_FAGSY